MSSADGAPPSQKAKPKFRPKAQPKKKPTPPPRPAVDDYRAAAANYRAGGGAGDGAGDRGGRGDYGGKRDGRGRDGRGWGGRGHRQWEDKFKGGRGGGYGRNGGYRGGGGGGGRGRGGFVPIGQDFFVGGGGSGPAAYMPSGHISTGDSAWGSGNDRPRGGGDTSESEAEEEERKRVARAKQSKGAATKGKGKLKSEGGSQLAENPAVDDDDEDMFGTGEALTGGGSEQDEGEGAGDGDPSSLLGARGGGKRRVKVPGMKVTGNVMSEEDAMRPVALPIMATAQDPTARLFAPADNQAELEDEEDSSLFFVQLPTKLPRPLPAFRRGPRKDKKGKGNASSVKEELGDPEAAAAAGDKDKAADENASAASFPDDDAAFDQGLRRMRPGKIGKLYVHKSGNARLVVGGVSLCVQSGLGVSFVEESVSINAGAQKSFFSFGQVTKRAICTPDFEQLYRRVQEGSAEGGTQEVGGSSEGPVKMEVDGT